VLDSTNYDKVLGEGAMAKVAAELHLKHPTNSPKQPPAKKQKLPSKYTQLQRLGRIQQKLVVLASRLKNNGSNNKTHGITEIAQELSNAVDDFNSELNTQWAENME
jgi:molecular chaperone GrpE (heat shock protein)